jgi:hypothetical protein
VQPKIADRWSCGKATKSSWQPPGTTEVNFFQLQKNTQKTITPTSADAITISEAISVQ